MQSPIIMFIHRCSPYSEDAILPSPFCIEYFVLKKFTTMVFTRSKLNELSKEELIKELLSFDNLSEKINYLTKKMDDFASKFDRVFSELQISKTCNSLLRKQIIDLE